MGFFATFWSWLSGQLATYIGDNTAKLAAALEPAIVTGATLYVMAWGYLHLVGKVAEPFETGLKRIALIALVLGAGLQLWLYNSVIVDTFYTAPSQLAAAMVGASDPVGTIDAIWNSAGTVADALFDRGGWSSGAIGFHIAGYLVYLLIGALCVYAMFLIAFSSIALAILLALGPLFIGMLFFQATRRLFSAWMAQLTNYGLITVLTVMVAALLLQVVQTFATQTAALGGDLVTVDALNMVLVAVLVFLILRQVMPIAAGLAGGVSLNSMGLMSRGVMGTLRSMGGKSKPAAGVAAAYAADRVRKFGSSSEEMLRSGGAAFRHTAAHRRMVLAEAWRDWRR